jgi:hypothetical protein
MKRERDSTKKKGKKRRLDVGAGDGNGDSDGDGDSDDETYQPSDRHNITARSLVQQVSVIHLLIKIILIC